MTPRGAIDAVQAELAELVGAEHVLSGPSARIYETDATASRGLRGVPDAVVLPGNAEEVRAVVAWACDRQVALVPRGGGTGLAGGAVPVDGGVVIGLERLNRVVEFAPEHWRMTVEAGVTTETVKRLARENGLFFPPDPGAAEQSQIGGNAATNAGGPHAFKYGATGSWVTGIEAVIPPGQLVRVGGAQKKDVGGYDLKSLFVGSEGTLGVITAVTVRLLPAPEAAKPVVAFFADPADATLSVQEAIASGLQPAVLDYLDGPTFGIVSGSYPGEAPDGVGFVLLAEVDGAANEVEAASLELAEVLGLRAHSIEMPPDRALWKWRDGVSGAVSTVMGGKVSEDIVVPPERLQEAIEGVVAIGGSLGLEACSWGHAGDGNMHASFLVDPTDQELLARAQEASGRLFDMAVHLGGNITGEHGIGFLKRGQLARQWELSAVELHERIKNDFDPDGILNPGKKLARVHR